MNSVGEGSRVVPESNPRGKMLTYLAIISGENGKIEVRPVLRLIGCSHSLAHSESRLFVDEKEKIWGYENRERGYRNVRKNIGEFLDHSESKGVTVVGIIVQEDIHHVEQLAQYAFQVGELRELRRSQERHRDNVDDDPLVITKGVRASDPRTIGLATDKM